MISVAIKGGKSGNKAEVTETGELTVGDAKFSKFFLGSAVANNISVNVVPPLAGHKFVIKSIILSGDRSIAAAGAVTDIFESTVGPTNGTIAVQIIQEEIAKQSRMVASNLNIEVSEGNWVNVKSDDVIVRCNISGYYIKA